MSDPNDPFAAQPYVPPSERGSDTDTQDAPPEASGAAPPAQESVANEQETPAETAAPGPEPEPAPEPDLTDSATEDTVQVEQPASPDTSSTHEMSADDREPTVMLPGDSHDDDGSTPPPRGRRRLAGTLALVVLAAGAGVGGAAAYEAIRGDDGGSVISSLEGNADSDSAPAGDVEKVAQRVLPSVVQINVTGGGQGGRGTGTIISSNGQILTNNHVIEPAADDGTISVAFNDGSNAKAEILGRDPSTDLAVIKAEGKSGLSPATLGTSDELSVGQDVVVIGSSFGLEGTVTSGIISALNRPFPPPGSGQTKDETAFPAIQTDAAINPGNSGGPLVDFEGRVVGINAAILSNAVAPGSNGVGFAIPIDIAKTVAPSLAKGEVFEHARIGVTVGGAVASDNITGVGAEIKEVTKGSAGADAGLKVGDIITSVNDVQITSSTALVASIRGYRPGEKITVTFTRDGDEKTTQVTLESDGGKLGS